MTAGRDKNSRSKRHKAGRLKARITWFQDKFARKQRTKKRKSKYQEPS